MNESVLIFLLLMYIICRNLVAVLGLGDIAMPIAPAPGILVAIKEECTSRRQPPTGKNNRLGGPTNESEIMTKTTTSKQMQIRLWIIHSMSRNCEKLWLLSEQRSLVLRPTRTTRRVNLLKGLQ